LEQFEGNTAGPLLLPFSALTWLLSLYIWFL